MAHLPTSVPLWVGMNTAKTARAASQVSYFLRRHLRYDPSFRLTAPVTSDSSPKGKDYLSVDLHVRACERWPNRGVLNLSVCLFLNAFAGKLQAGNVNTGFGTNKSRWNEVAPDCGGKLISGLISLLMRSSAKNTHLPSTSFYAETFFFFK